MVENATCVGGARCAPCVLLLCAALAACGASKKGDDGSSRGSANEAGMAGESSTTANAGGTTGVGGRGSGGTKASGGKAGTAAAATGGSAGSGQSGSGGSTGGTSSGGASGSSGSSGGSDVPLGPPSTDFLPLPTTTFPKLDLLLMIDNSLSMAGKQTLLADAVPNLVRRLTSPDCIGDDGKPTGSVADPNTGLCGDGGEAEFAPVRDLHVGIITSSLGDHGSDDVCSDAQNQANQATGAPTSNYNDLAQLLPSVRPTSNLYSWNNSGFLVWDPRDQSKVLDPHTPITLNETTERTFIDNFTKQLTAVGEHGCGYEASLEAWYRFLIDPEPVTTVGNDMAYTVRPTNANAVVLQQRKLFLRDDSVLGIIVLSDENDCSITDENQTQGWLVGYKGGVGQLVWHMPHSTSACAVDPNDPCCAPCGGPPVSGCASSSSDPACNPINLGVTADSMNLRCWAQKQRFGIDLLYPTSRYVEGLTSPWISTRPGSTSSTRNPLFTANETGVIPRSPNEVVFMAIVGVPWQDVSSADSWSGRALTYLSPDELAAEGRWAVMLGDPRANVLPTDSLMVESVDPRTMGSLPQKHPLLAGVTLGSPTDLSNTNVINGHEQAVSASRDDLQFSCIFELETPITSAQCAENPDGCDCNIDELDKNSPLCQGVTTTTDGFQLYGKAYPSLRELEVVKGVGEAGIVASICPKNVTAMGDKAADDAYGYNPAMAAFVERLAPKFTPMCLPVSLPVSASDPAHLACHVVAVSGTAADGDTCDCASMGLTNAGPGPTAKAYARLGADQLCGGALQVACDRYCVCEIPELTADELASCQTDPNYSGTVEGYCYVDPAQGAGSLDAVRGCPPANKRLVRFSGPLPGLYDSAFVDCAPEDN